MNVLKHLPSDYLRNKLGNMTHSASEANSKGAAD
jgi:hypothetical protein